MGEPGDRCIGGGLDHHLDCAAAVGPISMGICLKCGFQRPLWNSPPLRDKRQISEKERRMADEFADWTGDGDHKAWARSGEDAGE